MAACRPKRTGVASMMSRLIYASAATVLVAVGLTLGGSSPAWSEPAQVEIRDKARVHRDGSAVVTVLVTCPSGLQALEAHLSLSQDDQVISGQAGLGAITCSGRTQRVRVVLQPTEETADFHRGAAYASAFLLLLHPDTSMTVQAQDLETITLR